ncbi:MAG: hypothetical protein NTW11_02565 [Candidatus Staskawiczbacteria bacterium]|nr:hypothetical protein [Candidatus Staskawiczbacteria bacterium]
MQENKFLSVLAGAIIGFLFGMVYYYMPTSCLFAGPVVGDEILMPKELHQMLLSISAKTGGLIGVIIGILGGLSTSITMPRGHMSKSISCTCALVCPIVAFIQHGHFLSEMTAGRIAITFFYVVMLLFLAIPFGAAFSFIERIRE